MLKRYCVIVSSLFRYAFFQLSLARKFTRPIHLKNIVRPRLDTASQKHPAATAAMSVS